MPFTADALEQYSDPGQFVELALDRAKTWLVQALEHGDIDGIVELRSQAEAIRTYTVQKQLGKDTVLSATEIIRRAERGLGIAVKQAQAEGNLPGEPGQRQRAPVHATPDVLRDIFGKAPSGTHRRVDGYVMAATESEVFEAVIAEAKAEGDLSRANVVRKIKGEPKPERAPSQPKEPSKPISTRDPIMRKKRHLDSNRIVRAAVDGVDGVGALFDQIDYQALDRSEVDGWVARLTVAISSLTNLKRKLKETTQP